jgi:SAM-dependent methyltransferase
VIWAEGSAYIIGVERAMRDWKRLLRPGGVLVFSEMVWRTDAPSDALRAYWASEYPAMTRVPVRLEQAKRAGYRVLGHFDMGREAMDSYYQPLEARVAEMEARLAGTRVLDDLRAELAAYHACDGIVSFEMFVLQKP